jgi:hypothetical protein
MTGSTGFGWVICWRMVTSPLRVISKVQSHMRTAMPTINELGTLELTVRPRNVWMSTSHRPHGDGGSVQKRAYSYNPMP